MIGALPLGDLPALPLHEAGKYVAGAYVVLFALVLVYVAIMAVRASRVERELGELLARSRTEPQDAPGAPPPAADELEGLDGSQAESTRAEQTPV